MPFVDYTTAGTFQFVAPTGIDDVLTTLTCIGRGGTGGTGDDVAAGAGGGAGGISITKWQFIGGRTYEVIVNADFTQVKDAFSGQILCKANAGADGETGDTVGTGGSLAGTVGDFIQAGGAGGAGFTITDDTGGGGGGGAMGWPFPPTGQPGGAGTPGFETSGGFRGVANDGLIVTPSRPTDGYNTILVSDLGEGGNGGTPGDDCTATTGNPFSHGYGGGGGGGSSNNIMGQEAYGMGGAGGPPLARIDYPYYGFTTN